MKRHLLALPLLLAALPAFAQNPPPAPAPPAPPGAPAPGAPGAAPPAPPPPPIQGEVTLGYLSSKGNTDTASANATFSLIYRLTHWTHNFDARANSAEADAARTAEAYAASYKGKRQIDEGKSYIFAALDWRHDRFSAWEEEISESAGYGRTLLQKGNSTLNGELGAGYRQATPITGPPSIDEAILRAALDYELKFTDKTGFKQSLVIESGSSNTSTEAISALRANLIGKVGLVISLRIKNNSQVPAGVKPTDRYTSIALAYAF
jgi:putative salt-induced outer membrane protein